MLLPPFMHEVYPDNSAELWAYDISLGNGVKIITASENVTLENIKKVLSAGINVVIFTLLTLAPIFKFSAALLENINRKIYFDLKNSRYVIYIGLCISAGTVLVRFMSQFYNYYLLTMFITDAPQNIELQLRVDILSGITGLAVIFIGLIFAHICKTYNHGNNAVSDISDIGNNDFN
jgi:hypothetical protein